jgi:hypothetical protein
MAPGSRLQASEHDDLPDLEPAVRSLKPVHT